MLSLRSELVRLSIYVRTAGMVIYLMRLHFLREVEKIIDAEGEDNYQKLIGFSLWLEQNNLTQDWSFYQAPHKKDYMNLLSVQEADGQLKATKTHARHGLILQMCLKTKIEHSTK